MNFTFTNIYYVDTGELWGDDAGTFTYNISSKFKAGEKIIIFMGLLQIIGFPNPKKYISKLVPMSNSDYVTII